MVKTFPQEPHPNEFAKVVEELFGGIAVEPLKLDSFTEQMFQLKELIAAIGRAKMAKAADGNWFDCRSVKTYPRRHLQ